MADEGAFRIRRSEPADAPALADFAARMFADTFGPYNRPEDMAAHLADRFGVHQQAGEIADPKILTFLVEAEDRLIGYTQIRRIPPPGCVTGEEPVELGRFYVDRPWQGRGLAQRLMAVVWEAAKGLNGRTLWLGVWEGNPRAIAFYEKCGFRDVGSQEFLLGADLQTDCVMVADLADLRAPASGVYPEGLT
ncbi:MAG TPA: GNAT family N-acetyltransferase [Thermoanaerobaculia bacterium]